MPKLTSETNNLILFICQIIVVYTIKTISLFNLSRNVENKELWISLMSSCTVIFYRRLNTEKMFLTLPSNASMDVYPENKTSEFSVHLPKQIDLTGPWEVAIAENFYVNF